MSQLSLSIIEQRLARHKPEILAADSRGHAAVAMLIREQGPSPEVLFIIRAEHESDPWSGNIGFPGGRLHAGQETPQQAAERETAEELALNLGQAKALGRIDDLFGATMPVLVSCFVYQLSGQEALQPNHEVAATFWCPLSRLLEPGRHRQEKFSYRNRESTHPVVELLDPQQPLLWGITYRLMKNFFQLCELEFGSCEPGKRACF